VPAKRFTAEVYQGHSDCGVLVPFDPAAVWVDAVPRRIGYGKHEGYAVQGTVQGQAFESWIWFYFHEWRMVLPEDVLDAAGIGPGDRALIRASPHPAPARVPPYRPGRKRTR